MNTFYVPDAAIPAGFLLVRARNSINGASYWLTPAADLESSFVDDALSRMGEALNPLVYMKIGQESQGDQSHKLLSSWGRNAHGQPYLYWSGREGSSARAAATQVVAWAVLLDAICGPPVARFIEPQRVILLDRSSA